MLRINLPKKEINTFYAFSEEVPSEEYCRGLACYVARNLKPEIWKKAVSQNTRTYCLGKCYSSPSSSSYDEKPIIQNKSRESILLKYMIKENSNIKDYLALGGFKSMEYALTSMSQKEIIDEVDKSFLRGRGGAGFPTGKKWLSVFNQKEKERYLIVNADEGDPGAFSDRFLMEYSPHLVIEGSIISAYAIGAKKIYFYIRREYPKSIFRIKNAILEIKHYFEGKLKLPDILVEVGKGSYVSGEETAMINAIMGRRPEPMQRPPFPTERGLFGKPTVVNNVETISNIPYIVENGGKKYYELGFSKSRGTKLISLNSLFNEPGLYEVEFGITLDDIVYKIGGGLKKGKLTGVLIGAPFSGVVKPDELNTRLGYEELKEINASLGHGNIIAFNDETKIGDLLHEILLFSSYESCGKCTPCRVGTKRLEEIFSKGYVSLNELDEVNDIVYALRKSSLCGLGTGTGETVNTFLLKYRDEVIK